MNRFIGQVAQLRTHFSFACQELPQGCSRQAVDPALHSAQALRASTDASTSSNVSYPQLNARSRISKHHASSFFDRTGG